MRPGSAPSLPMPLDGQEPLASLHEVHVIDVLAIRVARQQPHGFHPRRSLSPVSLKTDGLEHDRLQLILGKSGKGGIERKVEWEVYSLDDAMPEVVSRAKGIQCPTRLGIRRTGGERKCVSRSRRSDEERRTHLLERQYVEDGKMRSDLKQKVLRKVYKTHRFGHGGLRQCPCTFRRSLESR